MINSSHTQAENWNLGILNIKRSHRVSIPWEKKCERIRESDNWNDKSRVKKTEGYAFITFSTWLANESGGVYLFSERFVFLLHFSTVCWDGGLASSLHLSVPLGPLYCHSGCASADRKWDKEDRENEGLTESRLCGLVRCRQDLTCRKAVRLLASYPWAAAHHHNRVTAGFAERSLTGKNAGPRRRKWKTNI